MLMPSASSLLVDGFHLESALALAHACAVAYADRREVEAAYNASDGFDRVDCFDRGDTQGFMASTRELTRPMPFGTTARSCRGVSARSKCGWC